MLTRKLLRDVRQTAGQFAAVAAVVACATLVYVSMRAAYQSLLVTRDTYYAQHRFADFFVHLEKAPDSALHDVTSIPGVLGARGRVVKDVPLEVEGNEGAVLGRIISMPDQRSGLINDIHMVTGSYFPGADLREVIVNVRFCEANKLKVGDSFQATINERKEDLRIVGTAYSPEYVYAISSPQQFAPNDREFAVIFAREAFAEDAFNMTNAFNELSGLLRPGTSVREVLDAIEERLDRHGVYHKHGRDEQTSNHYLAEEIRSLRNSALVTPLIFLVVAAVVIHVLLRRMTELQRTQIGLLCALGYTRARVMAHYVLYAVAIAAAGAVPGTLLGYFLADLWVEMYNMFFRFPNLYMQFSAVTVLQAFLLSAAMCALGAARSAWRVIHVEPAVAIRPQAPTTGRIVHRGRLGFIWDRLPLDWRISLRSNLRAWHRAFSTVLGVAIAVIILLIGTSMTDWMDYIIKYQFDMVDRSDIHVVFATERPRAAVFDVAHLDGVRHAEGVFQFGAELRNGWRKKTVLVQGLPADSRLYRVYDTEGRHVALPRDGLVVPRRLARTLDIPRGSPVMLDPYLKDEDERAAVVRAVVDQYVGLSVYATREYLAELLEQSGAVNGAFLSVEQDVVDRVAGELDDLPGVMSVTTTGAIWGGFEEMTGELMAVSTAILGLFAAVIAFSVIYNSSTVSIAEQERDLACMSSLGFDRGDVARVATNDIMPLGLLGTIVGLPLGVLLCRGLSRLYETDLYKLPVVIQPETYATVVALVLVFQLAARWVCRRRVYRIDIVRRLKTLE